MRCLAQILAVFSLVLATSCGSLIPKKVELFQREVREFPQKSDKQIEHERQAVFQISEILDQVSETAIAEGSSTNVVRPVVDSATLAKSVSVSLGPPRSPLKVDEDSAQLLSVRLLQDVSKLNAALEKFRDRNDRDAGKNIEGTGLVQVPYLAWAGGAIMLFLVAVFVGRTLLTLLATSNPYAAAGMTALKLGKNMAGKMFKQVFAGGETFKKGLDKIVSDTDLKDRVLEWFKLAQLSAQDEETQQTIKTIKGKPQ